MRVLHIGKYYAPQRGGIESYTQALAEWCVARGDAVAALVHQPPGRWRGERSDIAGVEVHRAGCLVEAVYTPISPGFPRAFSRVLQAFKPDLLHLHLPNPSAFSALLLPAACRLPWVIHWHADVSPDAPDWRLRTAYRIYRPFEQATLARAKRVIVTSKAYLDASTALAPWRNKTVAIPLGIADAPSATPQPALWPSTPGLRLLAVGRFSHYKGFDVLIDALARNQRASLLLVGSGECEAELHRQAQVRGVQARVRFAGSLDDATLASAYATADVFVLPSLDRSEAFGLVLLEAMRAGRPVVASAIAGSGVGSVVADGETGLLVPPGDASALSAAIDRMDDAALRSRFGTAGRARWEAGFTLQKSADAVREVYLANLG